MMNHFTRYVLGLALCFGSAVAAAQFELEDQVLLTDIDPATNNGRLGRTVAVGDDLVVMGAPEKTGGGAAYLFRISAARNLQFVREFVPQSSPSRYGGALVIDADWLAIGHASDDDPIEIYQRSGNDFILRKVLDPPSVPNVQIRNFGSAIDLEGDRLIVGDTSANVAGEGNAGVVLIFRRDLGGANNWGLEGVITNPPSVNGFGHAVAIGTDIAVVGDPDAERALVYQRSGSNWTLTGPLVPKNPQAGDGFGTSVAVEGDIVAVGATNGNNAAAPTNSGSVHLFARDQGGADQFGQIDEVVGSQAEFIDGFGADIRLRNGILSVGSPGANRAYLFIGGSSGWTEVAVVEPPPVSYGNVNFGGAVDFADASFLIGAETWDDSSGSDRFGAVFLYENPVQRRCGSFDAIFCDRFEP